MLNFQLSDPEFESLAAKYPAPENFFNYVEFCALINSAFTVKGIDKNPTARVTKVTSNDTVAARRKFVETSEEERQQVEWVL